MERGGREELVVETPAAKAREGVEVIGDVVVEEYLEFNVFQTDSSMFCILNLL